MSDLKVESARVGAHEFRFIPPDQMHFYMRGDLDDAHCIAFVDFTARHTPEGGGLMYAFCDLTQLGRVADGARRRVVNVQRPYQYGGMAVMVSTFSARVLVGMIMRAGKIIAPERLSYPYKFVSSLDEANTWFDDLRRSEREA